MPGDAPYPQPPPSATTIANAESYKNSNYSFWKFKTVDIGLIKFYLSMKCPILFGCKVDEDFLRVRNRSFFERLEGKVWMNFVGPSLGGHAMVICGYDDDIQAFKVLNSWGSNWGNEGYIWIDYKCFKEVARKNPDYNDLDIYAVISQRPDITITTTPFSLLTPTSVTSGGNIISSGITQAGERGICYSTNINPTTASSLTTNITVNSGTGAGPFTSNITGLTPNTTYYYRAYVKTSKGIAYGNEDNFTTTINSLPILTTTNVSSITQTTATSGGNISDDGGSPITSRGVCWNTIQNPTIADTKTIDGSGTGGFSSNITGLTANTTYYVRAYATNNIETAYGNELSFTTGVTIGSQVWMAQNLDVTTYRNGDPIPHVTDPTQWENLTTGAWCYYYNLSANGAIYGKLYNWFAVNDPRGLAPQGWHIPSDTEWTTLITYLGGVGVAGGAMKATTLWQSPNTGATNSSGFTALPGGRREINGNFFNPNLEGIWWSSTEASTTNVWNRALSFGYAEAFRGNGNKNYGFSVRCVRD